MALSTATTSETSSRIILPTRPFSDERVATGRGQDIEPSCMLRKHQWVARCPDFKPRAYIGQMNEHERELYDITSDSSRKDGISGDVFTIRMDNPVDPCSTTYENLRRFGLNNGTHKQKEYQCFLLCLEIGRLIHLKARSPKPVSAEEGFQENGVAVNTSCPFHENRPCYCGTERRDLMKTCIDEERALPWSPVCCSGTHADGPCYCVPVQDSYDGVTGVIDDFDVEEFNGLSVEEQANADIRGLELQPLGDASGEESPKVYLEIVRGRESLEDEDDIIAFRFHYVIPRTSSVRLGDVIMGMLEEHQKCNKKQQSGLYHMHRNVRNHYDFMELVDTAMFKEFDLHTNSQKNKDPNLRDMMKDELRFKDKIGDALDFRSDIKRLTASHHAVDNVVKGFVDTLHPDSHPRHFRASNYFLEGNFCPTMEIQRNMLDLDYSLLQLRDDVHVLLEKYNLWYYVRQNEKYNVRKARENTNIVPEPTPCSSGVDASTKISLNPQMDEFESMLNVATKDMKDDDGEAVRNTIKVWRQNMEGAAMNVLRHEQRGAQVVYIEEGKKNKTNVEARAHFRQWVHKSCIELKRYSRRKDNFNSTRGAFDTALVLAGRKENDLYKHPPWNPWHLGLKRCIAPNLGIGDMWIAELFKVIESVYFVSTHTGVILFCYICGGDAFTTRRDKNNFLFVGGPDGGKSHSMNVVKKHMLIPDTYIMKTKQSETAMDDVSVMDIREWREEEDLEYFLKNSKYANKQDIEKNRLTAALMYKLVRKQFKDKHDCQKWLTKMIITVFSAQTGSSTNETQLSKFIPAMLSRKPPKFIPIIKRKDGNRSVSAMVSAQSQRSDSNKRQESRYDAKYQYYDMLRFLIMKLFNLGILPEPTRKVFSLIMDKMKDKMSDKFKLNTRTELRIYGKAVQFMLIRVISTLFEHPKPNTKLCIGAAKVSNMDPWTMKDEKFQSLFVSEEGMEELGRKEECMCSFVSATGEPFMDSKKFLVKMNEERVFDEKMKPVMYLRTFQRYGNGKFVGQVEDADTLPETALGEFYKQWVSINHENFTRFVLTVNPLLTITVEDTVRAIWHTRSEICPDRFGLFEKQLLQIGINKLQNPDICDVGEKSKRDNLFFKIQENANGDSEISVNYNYVKLGTISEVIALLQNVNSNNSDKETDAYPDGFDVQSDYGTYREMIINMTKIQDSVGHRHLSPSRITKDNKPYWGYLHISSGTHPSFEQGSNIMPVGREPFAYGENLQTWDQYRNRNDSLPTYSPREEREAKMLQYSLYQHKHPDGIEENMSDAQVQDLRNQGRIRVVSTDHKKPVLLIKNNGTGIRDNSNCYLSINFIKENFKHRSTALEDLNHLLCFFKENLGYKYDGLKITQEEADRLKKKKAEAMQQAIKLAKTETEKEDLQMELDEELERLDSIVAGPNEMVGKTILLGSPYLGKAKGKVSSMDESMTEKRVCQPQNSLAVHYKHKEVLFRTEAANVPSKQTAELIGLDITDAQKRTIDIDIPMNDFANMVRLEQLCELPEDKTVGDYRALLEADGSPYHFSSVNAMNELVHQSAQKGKGYQFPNVENIRYPDNAAWVEQMSYQHNYVKHADGWKWVPATASQRKRKRTLTDEVLQSIANRKRNRLQLV